MEINLKKNMEHRVIRKCSVRGLAQLGLEEEKGGRNSRGGGGGGSGGEAGIEIENGRKDRGRVVDRGV